MVHLNRRGSVWWYRRGVIVGGHRCDLRLSLKTYVRAEAIERTAWLNLQLRGTTAMIELALNKEGIVRPTASQIAQILNTATDEALGRFIAHDIALPDTRPDPVSYRQTIADYCALMLSAGSDRPRQEAALKAFESQNLSAERIARLRASIDAHGTVDNADVRCFVDRHIEKLGLSNDAGNRELIERLLWKACCEVAPVSDPRAFASPSVADGSPQAAAPPAPSFYQPTPQVQQSAEPTAVPTGWRLSEATEECIKAVIKSSKGSFVSENQIRTAIRLFIYACGGDLHVSQLDQTHVGAFFDLMNAMPNRWGATREEREFGIPASLKRAAKLPLSEVGFKPETQQKHITWIGKVIGYSSRRGHVPAKALDFFGFLAEQPKRRERARNKRASWTTEEVKTLLKAPLFTGSAGTSAGLRFVPGQAVYGDEQYYSSLLIVHTGGRSDETAGMETADVFEDDDIPWIHIRKNSTRRVKTLQSERKIPIPTELLRLGFVEYIKKRRAAGDKCVFPQLACSESMACSKVYYKKVFEPWRQWAFPEGTAWAHRSGGANKDKDVYSFRGLFASLLKPHVKAAVINDIVGHEGATTAEIIYADAAPIDVMLSSMKFTESLTASLKPPTVII